MIENQNIPYGEQTISFEMEIEPETDEDIEMMVKLLDVPIVHVSSEQWDEKPFIFTE